MDSAKILPSWLQLDFDALLEQFNSNTLSHAVLLSGESGIGKTELANMAAMSILCKQAQPAACGECHSCKLAHAQTHPDLIRVSPEEGKKIISVDQIRLLMKEVYSTPQICENKVILISPADQLNHNAANALLKCLEEPPANTYFFVCTAFASRLPATVRSRCRINHINKPTHDVALRWLQNRDLETSNAEDRLLACGGRPLAALHQGEEILARHNAVSATVTAVAEKRTSVNQLAANLQAFDLVDLLPAYIAALLSISKSAHMDRESIWSPRALLKHLASAQKMYGAVQAGSTLNPQLATEDLIVNLQKCRQH